MGPPRPGPLLNRPVGDNCSQRGKPSQANRGPKNQGRSRRLKQLETETVRLKKSVAERDLEIEIMKEVAAKNW